MRKTVAIYERLLRLYPVAYRERYGGQMAQTLEDMLDDAATKRQQTAVWLKVARDLPISVTQSQLNNVGGIMRNDTLHYIKQTGLIVAGLVAPFFLVLLANLLSTLAYGRELHGSWLWSRPALAMWALILPGIALLFAFAGYARFISAKGKVSWLKRALNLRSTWPVVFPGAVALCILLLVTFHDSAHCLIGNPVRIARNPHQTVRCVEAGFLGGR